ncbi:hypothetical protein B9G98_03488 [Wickerhamiella sorbophila]|uniref:Regulator of rDNA transcription 14 n=1 Tax=Wickerhamiella sorbophila TaxID=45607 RepID=A0A2T0FLJ6_9ASCO|nr:hypothetical protein B9G98_03488 [Wickerhamiella sorbophila]PRT55868.1 hypothetical protein B9G98_03488 [Wickerhamiella sorbophila]
MSSKALDRLIARTLKNEGVKKQSRGQRKAKKKHAEIVRAEKAAADPQTEITISAQRCKKNLEQLHNSEEIDELKQEILKSMNKKTVYVKRSRKKHEFSFPGVTPGLAPVDYNPDESDDDEPY